MSFLNSKVKSVPNICGIELAFNGALLPSTIEGYAVFNNSIPQGTDFTKTYASVASINFAEESERSKAGIFWKQKLTIKFPTTDKHRTERLEIMHKVKYAKIKLTNNRHIVIGRNDFEQNVLPTVDVKVNEKLAQVEFSTKSIYASGYTPAFVGGLPVLFPIDFINED